MKKIKINVPGGYEIDKDKSSFEEIVFKKKNGLPKKWRELEGINGSNIHNDSTIYTMDYSPTDEQNKNVFPSKKTAKAGGVLLPMLLQLRDKYRRGWKPDWRSGDISWSIRLYGNELSVIDFVHSRHIFAFQSKDIAEQFLNNFRDMLEEYFNALTE